jgi:NAD(P)-dependent dehydrogenase (short-subunit alcohol dehydrogenase family)
MRIDGKVAVVTGAGNGIGRAIARSLAGAGAHVVVSDVLTDDGERTVAEIVEAGGRAVFTAADVSDAEQAENLIASAIHHFGRLDILANNAGIGGGQLRLHEIEPEDFDRVIDVNLRGTFLCSKYAIPHFLDQRDGRIINTASTYGLIGAPKAAAYCASKGAIINLTRQLAVDYGRTASGSTLSALDTSTPTSVVAGRSSPPRSSRPRPPSARRLRPANRSVAKPSRPRSPRSCCSSPPTSRRS